MMHKRRQGRSFRWRNKDDDSHRQRSLTMDFCLCLAWLWSTSTANAAAGGRHQALLWPFSPWLFEATPKAVFDLGQEAFS
jgi:hypothetical protein